MDIEILYEDKDILAINKPADLIVHSDGKTEEHSVAEWFLKRYPESFSVGEKLGSIERPGIVHRIDRETSGVLLLAKTQAGHECLKKQFQDREIEKIYHLFVYGNIREDFGTIALPIGKSKKDFRKKVAGESGREARTDFKVLGRLGDKSVTFLEARPKTGRTHQIRVHFRALYHPVIADPLYASARPKLLGFERLALHARSISFKNVDGKTIKVEAPYPLDFKRALDLFA